MHASTTARTRSSTTSTTNASSTTAVTTIIAGGNPGDVLTVRHLRIDGTQREIERALTEAASAAHGDVARPRPAADPLVEATRRRWFATHHPTHAQRLRGIADHFGVPDDASVSLDWLGTYQVPAGCSVAFYPGAGTKDGHGLLARNFDCPAGRAA